MNPQGIADKMALIEEANQKKVVAAISAVADGATDVETVFKLLHALSKSGLPAVEKQSKRAIVLLKSQDPDALRKVREAMAEFVK